MTKRRLIILVAAATAVVLAGGITVFLLMRDTDDGQTGFKADFDVHTGAEPAEREQASRLATSLATLPDSIAAGRVEGLSPEAQKQLANVKATFPPGTQISVDVNSWRRTGTAASVVATVHKPGVATPLTYLLLLLRQGDQWVLSEAYAQEPSPAVSR